MLNIKPNHSLALSAIFSLQGISFPPSFSLFSFIVDLIYVYSPIVAMVWEGQGCIIGGRNILGKSSPLAVRFFLRPGSFSFICFSF
jgi:hypothetical protein